MLKDNCLHKVLLLIFITNILFLSTGCEKETIVYVPETENIDNSYGKSGAIQKGPFIVGTKINIQELSKKKPYAYRKILFYVHRGIISENSIYLQSIPSLSKLWQKDIISMKSLEIYLILQLFLKQ